MAPEGTLDERGRLTIPPAYRAFLGRRIVLVVLPEGILLRPAAKALSYPGRLPPARTATGEGAALDEVA